VLQTINLTKDRVISIAVCGRHVDESPEDGLRRSYDCLDKLASRHVRLRWAPDPGIAELDGHRICRNIYGEEKLDRLVREPSSEAAPSSKLAAAMDDIGPELVDEIPFSARDDLLTVDRQLDDTFDVVGIRDLPTRRLQRLIAAACKNGSSRVRGTGDC